MKYIVEEVVLPNNPCQLLNFTKLINFNCIENNNFFKCFNHNDLNGFFISSKNLNIPGLVKIFNNNTLFFEFLNTENDYINDVKINEEFVALSKASNISGKIMIFTFNSNEPRCIVENKKSWFGREICFLNKNVFLTYYYENNKIILQKYKLEYEYINGNLILNTNLLKEQEFNSEKPDISLSCNNKFIFVGFPYEKQGHVLVLTQELSLHQKLIPNDVFILFKKFNEFNTNGYGYKINSNHNYLVISSPYNYYCKDKEGKECYVGSVYLYQFNSIKNSYEYVDKITNPEKELTSPEKFKDLFGCNVSLLNNTIFISNPRQKQFKGVIYQYLINSSLQNKQLLKLEKIKEKRDVFVFGLDFIANQQNLLSCAVVKNNDNFLPCFISIND